MGIDEKIVFQNQIDAMEVETNDDKVWYPVETS